MQTRHITFQPPSGGCVLKHGGVAHDVLQGFQPPSGGCVLKLNKVKLAPCEGEPAAFGRLCVETFLK